MAARDVILIAAMMLCLGIGYVAFHYTYNLAADKMLNNSQMNTSSTFVQVTQATKNITNRFDYFILVFFIGFALALIISSFFVSGNPIFMFIYILFLIIALVVSAGLSYGWHTISGKLPLAATITSSFPITNHLLSNLPYYICILGFLGMVVIYAKPSMNAGGEL